MRRSQKLTTSSRGGCTKCMRRRGSHACAQLTKPLLMSFFCRPFGLEDLLVLLLLLLLRHLKLMDTDLSFKFLYLSQPALFGCFNIWERLILSGRSIVPHRIHASGAFNDKLSRIAWRGWALHHTIDIR